MNVRISKVNEKYRQSIRPYFPMVGIPFGIVCLIVAIQITVTQFKKPQKLFSSLVGLIGVFGLIACAVLAIIYLALWVWQVSISPSFIKCSTFWGFYRRISWKSILSVEETNYEGIRYLKIKSSDTRLKLWLPF